VIPVPDHVPPGFAAVKLNAALPRHTGRTLLIVATRLLETVISAVSDAAQEPVILYVMVNVPGPAVAGLKVPAEASVMPVPDHVPPT
jgi:hypothetical protein